MFLADWSGRRVAAYAITWLVGFPVLMAAATLIGAWKAASSLDGPPHPGPAHVGVPHVDTAYVASGVTLDTAALTAHHRRLDQSGQLVFLPMQHSDVSVSLSVEATHDIGDVAGLDLLPWLLPPALLVAAWAWAQRSRPERD